MPSSKKGSVSTVIPLSSDVSTSNGLLPGDRKQNFRRQCCSKENMKEQALLIATIASVIIGVGVGIALRGVKCPTGEHRLCTERYSIAISCVQMNVLMDAVLRKKT